MPGKTLETSKKPEKCGFSGVCTEMRSTLHQELNGITHCAGGRGDGENPRIPAGFVEFNSKTTFEEGNSNGSQGSKESSKEGAGS
jgi:hypothetical protein